MSGNTIVMIISTVSVLVSGGYIFLQAWRDGDAKAREILRRAEDLARYGFPPDAEVGWCISAYDPRSQTWGNPFFYDPDREIIDNALARWRANGVTGRYRVIRKTTIYEVVTQEPEKNSGESSQEGTGIMAKHKGSSGDTPGEQVTGKLNEDDNTFTVNASDDAPGEPTTGESVDGGNIIFVNKPDGK